MKPTKKVRIIEYGDYAGETTEGIVNAIIADEEADGWHVKYIKPIPSEGGEVWTVFVLFTHAAWPKEQEDGRE